MKKLLKSFAALMTFASVTLLASGCGGSRVIDDFVMPEGGFDINTPVTIKFYHTMGQSLQDVLNMYLDDFYELYPNITVDHQSIGAYDDVRDQMTTAISSGNIECDMAYCYPDHVATYNKAKSVVTLDTLIDSDYELTRKDGTKEVFGYTDEQKADFVEAYYEEGKGFGDDKMYCLPFSKSSEVMYYNKTFFEENNLKVPSTWEEVEEVARQIKKIDPDSIPFAYDSESNLFITMCEQLNSPYTSATGEHFLFDNETNREFVSMFKEWYDDGLMTTKSLFGQYTSGLFTATSSQKCYICVGSSAGASYQLPAKVGDKYPFEVGIARVPQADAENHPAVIQQGPDVCIFRNKDPQKVMACWLLTKFLTTNVGFQAQFSMNSGYTPVIKSVYDYEPYKEFLSIANGYEGIAALSTQVTVEQESWYYYSPAFDGSTKARDEVGLLLSSVMSGTKTIDKAFADALQECRY